MQVQIVLSGRNYDLAEHLPERLELPDGCSLDEALEHLGRSLPEGKQLPASTLVAVSGRHLGTLGGHQPRTLSEGDELVLIVPVAGG